MPRCTPQERANVLLVCLCEFRDCQLDVSERANDANVEILELLNQDAISQSVALGAIDENHRLAQEGYAVCVDQYRSCAGLEPIERRSKRFSDPQKAALNRSSNAAWRASAAFGLAGVVVTSIGFATLGGLAGVGVGLVFAAATAGSAWAATSYSDLAIDPPDPDFDTITQPEQPIPPVIISAEELSEPIATQFNKLLANQAVSIGLGRAVVAGINKSQTAEAANDLDARDRQLTASRRFAAEWASVLEKDARLRWDTARLLAATAFGSIPIPKVEAIRIRSEILASGWPTSIRNMLADYSISGQFQEDVLRQMRIRLIDLSALNVTLSDLIAARALATAEEELVAVLQEFAAG
jgi:hypothetical protein